MLAQLLPVNGGRPVTLRKPVTVVGRSPRLCDLPLDNSSVSKLHCILVKTDGLVYMRDLGSTNGTRVNGQRVLRGALLPGDQISFSGSAFRVHLAPDSDNAVEESNAELSEHEAPIISEEANEDDAVGTQSDVRLISDEDLNSED
jgi:pSer/pThr/pTyr-binding forkhead associated (FHA) protein